MDNLTRTRDDMKSMSVDFLKALQNELEEYGTKLINQQDKVAVDNKMLRLCLRNLKYESKVVVEAKKIEREKANQAKQQQQLARQEARKAQLAKREEARKSKLEVLPEILSQKSTNPGVQALREAIKLAWLDDRAGDLRKHLENAQQLNNDSGLLDAEIKICQDQI